MKAVITKQPGGPEVFMLAEVPDLKPGPGEVLIRIKATGMNHADLLQRRGLYPPPPGVTDIMGLEAAGEVEELGPGVTGWNRNDRVMVLLAGGAYAEKAVVPVGMLMQVPRSMSFEEAASIPESFLTAYLELIELGKLKKGESVLIHAGASGVGTAAIQIARVVGAKIFTTASSEAKLERCHELGAEVLINYKKEEFDRVILNTTQGRGVDCILDLVGAPYLKRNLEAIAVGGRLLLVGLSGGAKTEINLREVLSRRVQIIGSTLRARPNSEKEEITRRFSAFAMPLFEKGELKPVVDRVYSFGEVQKAHEYLESHINIGKVVLKW